MKINENSDILIINVPMDRVISNREEISRLCSMPPLGGLYILSYLEHAGYTVSFIDLVVELFEKDAFVEAITKSNPKIVGFTTYVESWNIQNMLAKRVKQILPEAIIVAGGHCATFCFNEMLQNNYFDFCIKAEGEEAFVGICDYFIKNIGGITDIPNLVYKKENRVIENQVRRIQDIDELPYPKRDVLDFSKYTYPFTISTARGCPGRCIFCSAHAFWGNKVISRTPEGIINEIEQVYRTYGLKDFFIVDDTFTVHPVRTREFCELLDEFSNNNDVKFNWGCESRADVVTYNLMRKMKDTGCRMIQFGMESGNNEILKSIKKRVTYEQIYNAVSLAYEVGMETNVSFIIGHHNDTSETIDETIEKAVDLKRKFNANVLCSVNTPYPGTELNQKLDELGIQLLVSDYSKLAFDKVSIRTKNLDENDLRKCFNKANQLIYGNL